MNLRKPILFNTTIVPPEAMYRTLFNKSSFTGASLALNGYTKEGTGATWTASGNGVITSAAPISAAYTEFIYNSDYNYSALEDFVITSDFSVSSIDATSVGVEFGVFGLIHFRNLRCVITLDGTANNGVLQIYENTTLRLSSASSAQALSCSVGDSLRATITRAKNKVTFTVTNLTSPNTVYIVYNYIITTEFPNARGVFTITNRGGNYTFSTHSVVTTQLYNVNTIVAGDSISYGAGSTALSKRYYTLLGINYTRSCNLSGGGDETAQVLLAMPEMLALNANYYVLMIGGNDIQFGVATATWKANYNSIVSQIKAAGKTVIHCTPTPRNSFDMTPLRDHIYSVFPGDLISDTYTALWSGSSYTMNAAYNSGDGVHPNDAGHALMATTILTTAPQIV